jgi:hypothetical protein
MNDEYVKVVTQMGRPIPGQGLTTDPDNPQPYEKPPQFTSVHEASEFIFGNLIEEESYVQILQLMADDMPVMDIVRTLLFTGFTEGKWSPDLMLMLAEPVAYMLLALAERAGIDPVIYRGEDEDEADEVALLGTKFEEEKIQGMKQFLKSGKVPAQTLTPEMVQTIEQLPVDDSLMAQEQQQEEEVPAQDTGSLLAPPAPTEEEMQ